MTITTLISLSDAQVAYARTLVERGRYPNLSAVLQHGLELLRTQQEAEEAELADLRALLDGRSSGTFITMKKGRKNTARMIAARRAKAKR